MIKMQQRAAPIAGDQTIRNSACVGLDCVDNESYGSDTFRLKENNLRIHFDDTSNSASFPGNDWRITINDQTNGGGNYFGIDDATGGTRPFRVDAGAGNNALYIESGGNVGLGNNNPVTQLHMTDGNTPSLRLQQDGSAGFGQQAWDLAGNEASFFIRDATNGNTLPFRIRPSAPSSSIDIAANGSIGIGTASPNSGASLDLEGTNKGLLLNRLTTAQRTAFAPTEAGMLVFDTDLNAMFTWDGTQWNPAGVDTDDQTVDTFQLNASNELELSLEDDGAVVNTVDLSSFLDNTDDQALSLNVNSLDLEDGGSVDLSGYLDNTDDQALSLNVNSLDLEDGGSVDLSGYLDNTDDQALSLNVNSLELEDGGSVDLSGYLDNTDDQALSLNVNSLDLEDGGSVDLSGYLDNTDDQALSLNVNSLELEDGGSVDLSGYLDNTDNQNISGSSLVGNDLTIGISGGASETVDLSSLNNSGTDDQQLSLNGNSLDLENGGSVDLSGYLDNTDGQQLGNFILSGPILSIAISEGATTNFGPNTATRNVTSVNLSPLIDSLEDQIDALESENAAQQAQIDDLIARVEAIEDCACDGTLAVSDFNVETDQPVLRQNIPNPFDNTTSIGYFIPLTYAKANIVVSNVAGQILNNVPITKFGEGEITISKNRLQSAVYFYTLFVDGKRVASKRMVVE